MPTITTPYMELELPTPTVEPGPTYAFDNNTAFEVVDAHDHTTNKGVPVPTAGLNINDDLTFNDFGIKDAGYARFTELSANLSSPTDIRELYVVTNDLWFNDGLGNQIRFTQNGAVKANISETQETPTGTINGINVTFMLSLTPTSNAAVKLYQDGLLLIQGTDYTISGAQLNLTDAPALAQSLLADYY